MQEKLRPICLMEEHGIYHIMVFITTQAQQTESGS